jgi:DNA processing protein
MHNLLDSLLAKYLLFLRLPEVGAGTYWQLHEQGVDIESLLEIGA